MFFWLLYIIPKNHLSYIVGKLVSLPIGLWAVKLFAKKYKINLDEAEKPIRSYKTIADLFTRRLKEGLRPIESDWVHPVDSEIREHGWISDGKLVQVKGKNYSLKELIPCEDAKLFEEGYFITYYLCPTDYHRIHSACSGFIYKSLQVPGKLWPVNDWSVNNIKDLFSVNERAISLIQTSLGKVASVKVGATNVGKIELVYDKSILTNQCNRKFIEKAHEPAIDIRAGDELGCFHMGSTVVLVLEKSIMDKMNFQFIKSKTKVGQKWQSI